MKYFIEPREKKRLQEFHFVEFDAIFSAKELQTFFAEISFLQQKEVSYNFFQSSSLIKTLETTLGKIAANLLDMQSIRLCFDAIYKKQNIALPLETISSYQPLLLGAAMILNPEYRNQEIFPLPSDTHMVSFFSPNQNIDFHAFSPRSRSIYCRI